MTAQTRAQLNSAADTRFNDNAAGDISAADSRDSLKDIADSAWIAADDGTPLLASAYTAADVLTKIKTVDGAGSGLDADLLDGNSSAAFAAAAHTHPVADLSDASANGRSLVSAANYAAMKALLDLEIGTDVQAYDADLTTWAGLTPSANAQSLVTASDYAAMRALLDLEAGTDFYSKSAADAAFVAKAGDTMTGALTIAGSTSGFVGLTISTSDAGASGPTFDVTHASASPAVNDTVAAWRCIGRDSGGGVDIYGFLNCVIADPTATTEDSVFGIGTVIAGALATRLAIGAGVYIGAATGGDQGVGTVNAVGVYDDSVLLVCPALQDEYLEKGEIDLAKWDAMVPDLVMPEERHKQALQERVAVGKRLEGQKDGTLVYKEAFDYRPVTSLTPVFDEEGRGLDAVETPVMVEIVTPERRLSRRHEMAHLFAEMVAEGFDPRDPLNYLDRMEKDQALPGMPRMDQWEHNTRSVGEMFNRKWLAMEFLALAFRNIVARVQALEAAQP